MIRKKQLSKKHGRNVTYPVRTMVYPTFFIKNLTLDGYMVDAKLNPLYSLSGMVGDLNFDQKISKKPTVFKITSKENKTIYLIHNSRNF